MNGLISRQTVRETLLDKGQSSRRYKLGETWELNWLEIEDALSSIPTIDAEPVKHGHWIKKPSPYHFKCSSCGVIANIKFHHHKFCWHCGAKMDGGAENETD